MRELHKNAGCHAFRHSFTTHYSEYYHLEIFLTNKIMTNKIITNKYVTNKNISYEKALIKK
jgi:hypothetical protein